MSKYVFYLTLLLTSCFYSCSRKNFSGTSLTQSPKAELLSNYVWRETSVIAYTLVSGDTIRDNISKANVDQDDLTVYNEDGTFIFEEGETKLKPVHAQVYLKGTWKLNEDGTVLMLESDGSVDEYRIIRLDASILMVNLAVDTGEGQYKNYLITYSARPKIARK